MLGWLTNLLNNPVLSSLFGAIIGFVASFFAQDWLENRKFRRTLRMKAWETKVETLRQFSEDLELWLYLTILENDQESEHDSHIRISKKLQALTEKLIRNKTHLMKYPELFAQYESLIELTEPYTLAPIHLASEEIDTLKSLLKTIQYEIQAESGKLSP